MARSKRQAEGLEEPEVANSGSIKIPAAVEIDQSRVLKPVNLLQVELPEVLVEPGSSMITAQGSAFLVRKAKKISKDLP